MILLGQNHLNSEVGMRNAENRERCKVEGIRREAHGSGRKA
jgi:chemotaxis response regulator CheB